MVDWWVQKTVGKKEKRLVGRKVERMDWKMVEKMAVWKGMMKVESLDENLVE